MRNIVPVAVGSDDLKPVTHAFALGFYRRVPTEGSSNRLCRFYSAVLRTIAGACMGRSELNTVAAFGKPELRALQGACGESDQTQPRTMNQRLIRRGAGTCSRSSQPFKSSSSDKWIQASGRQTSRNQGDQPTPALGSLWFKGLVMSRFTSNKAYGHGVREIGPDHYRMWWVVDFYYPSSRLRHPRRFERDTGELGAKRFAKKWNVKISEIHGEKNARFAR